MSKSPEKLAIGAGLALLGAALLQCSSASTPASTADGGVCFPDHDGISGCVSILDLTVDDTTFSKRVLSAQNASTVTLTLKNTGTKPHGFEVECTSVLPGYPDLPAACPKTSCFPAGSTIAPLAPNDSKTVTFETPIPDGIIFPFKSSEPADSTVKGLSDGQFSLM